MSLAAESLAEDTRIFVIEPPLHLLVIPFPGFPPGFLAGPAQAVLEEFADVLGVVMKTEVSLDDMSDAVGGPQFVPPAMLLSPLQEEFFQL
jgi:hypothetical protein